MNATKPPRSILDPGFKYTNAASTDIARTFARIRREQAATRAEAKQKVAALPRKVPA